MQWEKTVYVRNIPICYFPHSLDWANDGGVLEVPIRFYGLSHFVIIVADWTGCLSFCGAQVEPGDRHDAGRNRMLIMI